MAAKPVVVEGVDETIAALDGVAVDVAPGGRGSTAAGEASAQELATLLRVTAASSGVPVAPRVARSVKVRRGKVATVSIGDATPVGAGGAPAYKLAWGSEHGPAEGADVNRFAVPHGAGYWIKPAVDRVQASAPETFELAVAGSIREHGL